MIENIQQKATKSVIGLHDLCYIDRLDHLHLPSLQDRRERGDLIEVHKIMNKLNDGNLDHLFRLRDDHRRHGDKRIFKPYFRTVKRGNSFTQCIINQWNKLPLQTKTAKSSIVLKRRYDKTTGITGTSKDIPTGGGRMGCTPLPWRLWGPLRPRPPPWVNPRYVPGNFPTGLRKCTWQIKIWAIL